MVIVHLSGGFGNQLFSYAFGLAVAEAKNEDLYLDSAIQDQDWFFRNPEIFKMQISYAKRITYKIGRSIFERGILNKIRFKLAIGMTTTIVTEDLLKQANDPIEYCKGIKGNIYLKGNWGNESWFKPVKEQIVEKFQFSRPLSVEAAKIAEEIMGEEQAVTIHIRRGDYVKIGIALQPSFYLNAMDIIADQVSDPIFYCFSEDLEWAKDAFKDCKYEIRYPQYESDEKGVEDFRLLSMGKHQIISNSSYSWWAAYLNQNESKQVVIPCKRGSMWDEEFVVEGWHPISFETCGKPQK